MRVVPSLLLSLSRAFLVILLLAGVAFPATFLFSSPAMAVDGGGDGGDDGGGSGSSDGGFGNSNSDCGCDNSDNGGYGCSCGDGGGFGGGAGEGGSTGESEYYWHHYDWQHDGGSTSGSGGSENYWPSYGGNTSGCVIQNAYSDGFGHRIDSTFVPNWGACR